MCTVTWTYEKDRYSLFVNRDELRTRLPSLSPTRRRQGDTRYLAPTDGAAGGTWVAVNEFGLLLCLLNDYSASARLTAEEFTSRGHLVTDLIRARDLGDLDTLWSSRALSSYRPCKLLALTPGHQARLLTWNGVSPNTVDEAVAPPLCSSSFDEAAAGRVRAELYGEMTSDAATDPRKTHLRFHQSHRPERGPYSVCMHRPDAVTVSFTVVEVTPGEISMAYAHGAPCSTPLEHLVTLDRRP